MNNNNKVKPWFGTFLLHLKNVRLHTTFSMHLDAMPLSLSALAVGGNDWSFGMIQGFRFRSFIICPWVCAPVCLLGTSLGSLSSAHVHRDIPMYPLGGSADTPMPGLASAFLTGERDLRASASRTSLVN